MPGSDPNARNLHPHPSARSRGVYLAFLCVFFFFSQIEDAKSVLKVAADSDKDGSHRKKFNKSDMADGSHIGRGAPSGGRGGRGKRY